MKIGTSADSGLLNLTIAFTSLSSVQFLWISLQLWGFTFMSDEAFVQMKYLEMTMATVCTHSYWIQGGNITPKPGWSTCAWITWYISPVSSSRLFAVDIFKHTEKYIWIVSTVQVCNTETNILLEHFASFLDARSLQCSLVVPRAQLGLSIKNYNGI